MLKYCLLGTVLAVLLCGPICAEEHAHSKGEKPVHSGEAHSEEKGVVHLATAQLKLADLTIQPVGSGKLAKVLEGPGEVVLNEDKVAHITPRVPGVVTEVLKTIGDNVNEGELLAVLESPELGNAKIEYFTAKLNLELARLDLEREQLVHDNSAKLLELLKAEPEPGQIEKQLADAAVGESKSKVLGAYSALRLARAAWTRAQKLLVDKVTSQADYELAAKQHESALAEYRGASEEVAFGIRTRLAQTQRALRVAETTLQNCERRLHVLGVSEAQLANISKEKDEHAGRYELRAPFAGTITEKHITIGEHLGIEASCFTIADCSTVWCNLRIYPKDLKQVKAGQIVRVKPGDADEPVPGKLALIYPIISEKTRTAFARVILNNAQGHLRPGLFVTGAVVVEEREAPVVIPSGAIQTFEGQEIVFATGDAEGEFQAKPVKRGHSDGEVVEVLEGLKAGERVVVRNSFVLKAELGKGEGGHEH